MRRKGDFFMPIIYLSPSTQEFNPYVGGGNEEYYMNLVADAMEPYLAASGIQFVRNTPEMTAASSITASNSGNYDLLLRYIQMLREERQVHAEVLRFTIILQACGVRERQILLQII